MGVRRLNCVCAPRHYSRLHPSIWAGYNNHWSILEDISDEFETSTKAKNSKKWRQHAAHPKHGVLSLCHDGSHMTSQRAVQYGYFECCFRASDSSLESSFSLISGEDPNVKIQAFAYSAAENARHRVKMDAIGFDENLSPSSGKHNPYVTNRLQKHIFAMPETPVIVGVDWTPDHITTYVDGHVIRQLENKYWHTPMHVCFSLSSVKIEKSGRLTDSKRWRLKKSENFIPFEVYYLRCWHRFPDHRKLTTPGLEVSPTHYQKTTSSVTHRSIHYKKNRVNGRERRSSILCI